METLAPILRRAGVNPADFLDGLARRLPQLLDRGLDVAARRIGGALDRIAEPRVLIPNSVERAAAGAAGNLRALAMSAKEPLGRVGGEIREALGELADAARRSDPNAPRPDGPEPPRRVSPEIAARRDLAQDFYRRQGFDNDRSAGHLSGIDFSHPVEVVRIPRGTVVEQWAFPGKQGSYYVTPGTDPGTVGVSLRVQDSATGQIVPRERVQYRLTEDVEMLRSTAAPVTDTWSVRTQPVATQGGGIQLFTAARDGLRRVR